MPDNSNENEKNNFDKDKNNIFILHQGDLTIQLEDERNIFIRASTDFGDPVELSCDELAEVIKILQDFFERANT